MGLFSEKLCQLVLRGIARKKTSLSAVCVCVCVSGVEEIESWTSLCALLTRLNKQT